MAAFVSPSEQPSLPKTQWLIGSVMGALTRDGDKTFLISICRNPKACRRCAKVPVCSSQFAPAKVRWRHSTPMCAREGMRGSNAHRRCGIAFTSVAD